MGARSKPQRPARRESAIFRATLEELALADYGALSMERIAVRAHVNKTTLYRRWPSKALLVQAAVQALADRFELGPSTGSLRGDLLVIGSKMLALGRTVEARGLMRLRLLQDPEPELAQLAAKLQARRQAQLSRLLAAAVARKELRIGADLGLVLDLLAGFIHVRVVVKNIAVTPRVLERAVDTLTSGIAALNASSNATRRTRKSAAAPARREHKRQSRG